MGDKFEQTEPFKTGLKCRREVLGDAYVDKALQGIDNPLQKSHQQYITEAWSNWARPGLTRQQRSLLNIGILMTLNRSTELGVHIRGALRNGLSEEEITEAITHTMMYSGVPAGVEGSKIAARVIKEMKESGEKPYDKGTGGVNGGATKEASQSQSQNGSGSGSEVPPELTGEVSEAEKMRDQISATEKSAGQGEEAPLAS